MLMAEDRSSLLPLSPNIQHLAFGIYYCGMTAHGLAVRHCRLIKIPGENSELAKWAKARIRLFRRVRSFRFSLSFPFIVKIRQHQQHPEGEMIETLSQGVRIVRGDD